MKKYLCSFLSLLACGCAQTIDLRASHFAVPVVADAQWSGYIYGVGASNTRVRLLEDFDSNPPVDGKVEINKDLSFIDMFSPVGLIGLDAGLSFGWGGEIFLEGSKMGLRWQFLNHGAGDNKWVSAVHVSSGNISKETSYNDGASEVASTVASKQYGISAGYRFSQVAPYISYIHEEHEAKTDVKNSGGEFGPYKDSGSHQYITFGLTSVKPGFIYGVEISSIQIKWKDGDATTQSSAGFRMGYGW